MACHNYKLPCGHSVYGICGCSEVEMLATEVCKLTHGSVSVEAIKPYILRAFRHGAVLQNAIDRAAAADGEALPKVTS